MGSTSSRIKYKEACVPCAGVNQELTPRELHLSWFTPKEVRSGSGMQPQLGSTLCALREEYFQSPAGLQSPVVAGEQHSNPRQSAASPAHSKSPTSAAASRLPSSVSPSDLYKAEQSSALRLFSATCVAGRAPVTPHFPVTPAASIAGWAEPPEASRVSRAAAEWSQ